MANSRELEKSLKRFEEYAVERRATVEGGPLVTTHYGRKDGVIVELVLDKTGSKPRATFRASHEDSGEVFASKGYTLARHQFAKVEDMLQRIF